MAYHKHIRVLVNPTAHAGRARRDLERSGLLGSPEVECVETTSAAHLRQLVREGQKADLDVLAVAGGDGTFALAVDALTEEQSVPLALLPLGSGNDFSRHLGIHGLREGLDVLHHGTPRAVDLGRAEPGGRFGCAASVGLDEDGLRLIHRLGLPRSKATYVAAGLCVLWTYRPRTVCLRWEGGGFEGEIMFLAVANTCSYAGGFRICPDARLDDGLLDLCIVRRMSRSRLLWHLPRFRRGSHAGLSEVTLARSAWVRIEGVGREVSVLLDGELPGIPTPVEIRCEAGAVRMLTP
jgi:diacylglycerol kinase (ATP)